MKVWLGRRYRLSASHRLHAESFTEAENQLVYGKCANPHGHGHNYTVEVLVRGEIDAGTGMVCNLADLDACVEREVIEPFDHTNLNTLPCFRQRVPTTENLCVEIEGRLRGAFTQAEVVGVRIEETSNNFFEASSREVPSPSRQHPTGRT